MGSEPSRIDLERGGGFRATDPNYATGGQGNIGDFTVQKDLDENSSPCARDRKSSGSQKAQRTLSIDLMVRRSMVKNQ